MPVLLARPAENHTFEQLLTLRLHRSPSSNQELIRKAFNDAVQMYGDKKHWTGAMMLEHCLGVLKTYLQFEPDDEGVVACLLHHALDVKEWTLDDIEKQYGKNVRSIVSGVHLLSHVTMKDRRMSLEHLRLMFMRVSDDIHVVLLILCDHTYKLERMHEFIPEDQRNLCHDVLNLFAPVAARLGIYSLKNQMEALAFPVVYPTDAVRIHEQLDQIHKRHGHFLEKTSQSLEAILKEEGITAHIDGREKAPYSIFQKLKLKTLGHVEDIYDLFALRVIVENETACYQTLGVLHRIGHPVAGRFKDYIGFPKPNGYQSLHTTLAQLPGIPEGMLIEVQIRTKDMHREADIGIAAHWTYKQGGTTEHATRRARLQRALTIQNPAEEEHAGGEHIFALTPNGDIIELPEGATPLDFAFNVHSMLGLSFKGARVNGVIVPLQYELQNGDIVEVMRYKEPRASANWMPLLKTSSARARLKKFLMEQDRPSYIQLGRAALNEELTHHHLPLLDPDLSILREVDDVHLTFAEREDLLVSIGQGAQSTLSVLQRLPAVADSFKVQPEKITKLPPPALPATARVDGNIPMPIRFAKCCKPDEGVRSKLTGIIGRDGSVRVHREACKLTRNANPERVIGVKWVEAKTKKKVGAR